MATSGKQVAPGGGIDAVASLLQLAGGTQTKTNPGDTSALQGVLAQLQGQDFNGQLQSIFQQAAGQIPGLSSRLTNAVGARSGNNGAVAAMLQKLLQQTTLAGQQQVVQQQGQNLSTQAQAASAIANATRGTTSKTGTNLEQAGKVLGGLQLAGKALDSDIGKKGKDLFSSLLSSNDAGSTVTGASEVASPVSDFNFDSAPSYDYSAVADVGQALDGFDFSGGAGAEAAADIPVDESLFGDYFNFADGGLVGRDGKRDGIPYYQRKRMADAGLEDEPQEDQDARARKQAIERANAARKNPKSGKDLDEYDKSSGMVDKKTGIRFADGGQVSINSGGGRRSSAPTFSPDEIVRSMAGNFSSPAVNMSPAVALNPAITGTAVAPSYGPGLGRDVTVADFAPLAQMAMATLMGNIPFFMAKAADTVTQTEAPTTLNSIVNAVNTKNPLAIVQALAKLNKLAEGNSSSGDTGGYNSLGQATGVANGGGFSGFAAALSGEGAFGDSSSTPATEGSYSADGTSIGYGDGSFASGDGSGSGAGYGSGYGSSGFGGGSGAGGTSGAGSGGYGGYGAGAKNGGKIEGPGTGTSDSIPARLSDGEYVISADVVDALGSKFFDSLQSQFHKKA